MKVVLFCGGYGMRMRNAADDAVPKPMQLVGPRPLIWHVMRYYAHYGHKDFVLCLGYGAQHIKDYFLNYRETESNDFVMRGGEVELLSTDMSDWSITFVDTGLESAIGERLRRARPYLDGDEYFLANYADVLSDAPMNDIIDRVRETGSAASMLLVPPQSSFHCVDVDGASKVTGITPVSEFPIWENGGYFVLTQEVFDHPANMFVAGFIGMPQMNFFDGELKIDGGEYTLECCGATMKLCGEAQEKLKAANRPQGPVTAGIRPEQAALTDKPGSEVINAKISVSEMMGSEIYLHADVCGKDVVIRIPTTELSKENRAGMKRGAEIMFTLPAEYIQLFDPETQLTLL